MTSYGIEELISVAICIVPFVLAVVFSVWLIWPDKDSSQ